MKRITTLCAALALGVAACGDDEQVGDDDPDAADDTPDADEGPPSAPALGAQLDRMGRPAINTAANHTFDGDATATQAGKDAWNTNDDPSTWVASFAAEIRTNLGILDSLDATCGNQLGADLATPRYSALAGLLANDMLYVKSTAGACTAYLAVEADALGILANNDCGGRVMGYDVILTSYSVLAAGALGGVDDNIAAEAVPASATTFPFLADPL